MKTYDEALNEAAKLDAAELLKICEERYIYEPTTGRVLDRESKKESGCLNQAGYRHIRIKGERYKTHLVVWLLNYRKLPINQIDHIDGIRNNNKIENLRDVTQRENAMNRPIHRAGRLTGARFYKLKTGDKQWYSCIRIKEKRMVLGKYDSEEEAHMAYSFAVNNLDDYKDYFLKSHEENGD